MFPKGSWAPGQAAVAFRKRFVSFRKSEGDSPAPDRPGDVTHGHRYDGASSPRAELQARELLRIRAMSSSAGQPAGRARRRVEIRRATACALSLTLLTPAAARAATLEWLGPSGDVAGDPLQERALALSGDGSVVVFESPSGQWIRWTHAGGPVVISGSGWGIPAAVNADGSVVVGVLGASSSATLYPTVWTAPGNMTQFTSFVLPQAVDSTGHIVVGYLREGGGGAWVGSAASGTALVSTSATFADGISGDGSLIVGYNGNQGTVGPTLWASVPDAGYGNPQYLGAIPGAGGSGCGAFAASYDGGVVVGGTAGSPCGAWYWTASGGFVVLPALDPSTDAFQSSGWAVSADGSRIVGLAQTPGAAATAPPTAFVWDAAHGTRSLAAVLTNDYGYDVQGATLQIAASISADGTVIAGVGYPAGQTTIQVFRATLTPSPAAPATPAPWILLLAATLGLLGAWRRHGPVGVHEPCVKHLEGKLREMRPERSCWKMDGSSR
jgi:uncharacterized membrane protein